MFNLVASFVVFLSVLSVCMYVVAVVTSRPCCVVREQMQPSQIPCLYPTDLANKTDSDSDSDSEMLILKANIPPKILVV